MDLTRFLSAITKERYGVMTHPHSDLTALPNVGQPGTVLIVKGSMPSIRRQLRPRQSRNSPLL
jgi:hypothetical protein